MNTTETGTEQCILIGGGVGPMAGVALHAKIIESTVARSGDPSHLTVHHISESSEIPDRTGYLEALARGETAGINPGQAMAAVLVRAVRGMPDGRGVVVGVPCNTFHAQPIISAFRSGIEASDRPIRFIHMLDETVGLLRERLGSGNHRVGVLGTNGTRMSRIYDDLLGASGFHMVQVPETLQSRVHDAIYNPEWGIKAVSPVTSRAKDEVEAMARHLINTGVDAIIPACTELPLALPGVVFEGTPLVDPVLALARALVRAAEPGKLAVLAKE